MLLLLGALGGSDRYIPFVARHCFCRHLRRHPRKLKRACSSDTALARGLQLAPRTSRLGRACLILSKMRGEERERARETERDSCPRPWAG